MVTRTMRAMAWMLIATVAVFTLSGCSDTSVKVRLGNLGTLPITELLIYPTPPEGWWPGPEGQINRLPKDASGSIVALLPDDAVLLDSKYRNESYDVSVTFYDSKTQSFRKVQVPDPLDLSEVKRGSVVIVWAGINANGDPVFAYEIHQENISLLSWLGW